MAIYLHPDPSESTAPYDLAARAIEKVATEEQGALNRYARCKMSWLRGAIIDSDANDLRQEAMARVLDGTRHLKDGAEVVAQLRGMMKSVANGWYQKSKRACKRHKSLREETLSSDPQDANDDVQNANRERARVVVETLILSLQNDQIALRIVEAVRDGKRPKEIRRELGIDAKTYNAAWQRIRRRAKRAAVALIPTCRHRTFRRATHRKAFL
jgi:DNA-directed RNA polymerase specialized sigma24 family protein